MSAYIPTQGDIIILNFDPQTGHEQGGNRPALVVSNWSFSKYTRLALVCPITSKIKDFPMHILLDNRTRTQGQILCQHIRSVDYQTRNAHFAERLPTDLMGEVLNMLQMFVD